MRTYRKYDQLSSGHCLAMYITRHRRNKQSNSYIVAICIFKTKRECDYWFRHQEEYTVNMDNTWGMEGIIKALQWLKELQKNIQAGESIIIYWLDKQRQRTFKFLQRYGFVEGIYLDWPCYVYKKL